MAERVDVRLARICKGEPFFVELLVYSQVAMRMLSRGK